MSAPTLDWAMLLREIRGYLGLSSEDPVPEDQLVAQAKANGYTDREIRNALRETDSLDNVGTLDNPAIVLAEPRRMGRGGSTLEIIESWQNADLANTESGVWPPELLKREQWMGHVGKKSLEPWADRDHPEASEDENARWKWGLRRTTSTARPSQWPRTILSGDLIVFTSQEAGGDIRSNPPRPLGILLLVFGPA